MSADLISVTNVTTVDELFHQRARRSPDGLAYQYFDDETKHWCSLTWSQMLEHISRWQEALLQENLEPGERVAIMLKNCPQWVMFDQAAMGLGLVTVPLYTSDQPENVAHILQDSGARLLLIDRAERWGQLSSACDNIGSLTRVISMKSQPDNESNSHFLCGLDQWLPQTGSEFHHRVSDRNSLATIVYTSGTTGKSKGVMLSHHNLLSNAWASSQTHAVFPEDIALSFLPLSHALERTGGYLIPIIAGASVAYVRSIQQLQEDLATIRPTIMIAVPRIFERIQSGLRHKLEQGPAYMRWLFKLATDVGYSRFEHSQGRSPWQYKILMWPLLKRLVADKLTTRLGGRLRLVICGGAALQTECSHTFISLGVDIFQGYGLTEASPVVSVNRADNNDPASVGNPLPGVEVRLDKQHALQVRGPNIMLGYWKNETATKTMFSEDGWLNTGDIASISESGQITITGRIKEIIVLSNGEKIPPGDMEAAILGNPLFEQVMLVGEGKPYLSLLAVINRERWSQMANEHNLPKTWPDGLQQTASTNHVLTLIAQQTKMFPRYARIRRVALLSDAWSIENGLLTPTLKIKRAQVLERYYAEYEKLYHGYLQ